MSIPPWIPKIKIVTDPSNNSSGPNIFKCNTHVCVWPIALCACTRHWCPQKLLLSNTFMCITQYRRPPIHPVKSYRIAHHTPGKKKKNMEAWVEISDVWKNPWNTHQLQHRTVSVWKGETNQKTKCLDLSGWTRTENPAQIGFIWLYSDLSLCHSQISPQQKRQILQWNAIIFLCLLGRSLWPWHSSHESHEPCWRIIPLSTWFVAMVLTSYNML